MGKKNSNNDIFAVIRQILSDEKGNTCSVQDCPIHSERVVEDEDLLTDHDLTVMTAAEATELAIAIVAGAHNNFILNKFPVAVALQKQADLWFRVADILKQADAEQQADAKAALPPQDDLEKDLPLQKPYDGSAATA